MSIGDTLAQARRGSGLTIAEVSQRTRIRETLVKDIERDDYSGCGGDFYTRGHIRAIARVVGADPGPLIEEYDAARLPPPAEPVADSPQFTLVRPRDRQRQEPSGEPPTDPFRQIPPVQAPGWQQAPGPERAGPPGEPVAGTAHEPVAGTAQPTTRIEAARLAGGRPPHRTGAFGTSTGRVRRGLTRQEQSGSATGPSCSGWCFSWRLATWGITSSQVRDGPRRARQPAPR